MDTISVLVGFLIGVVAAAIAVELGLKKLFQPPQNTKLTASWRLSEFEAPLVVAVDASQTLYPAGSEVVTAGAANPEGFKARAWRRNASARGSFVVDREKDRALLFLGPVAEGTLAVSTIDPDLVARLRAEHRRLWQSGETYVEEMRLGDVVGKAGLTVRTRGHVREVVPYRGRHLMRITDGTNVVGVLVDAPLDLANKDVVVTGRLERGASGYTLLDADEVRLVRRSGGAGRPGDREVAVPVGVAAPQPDAPSTAAPAVAPAQEPARSETPRVVRVPDPARLSPPEPEPEPQPEVEFVAADVPDHVSEAERNKAKVRVVLHR